MQEVILKALTDITDELREQRKEINALTVGMQEQKRGQDNLTSELQEHRQEFQNFRNETIDRLDRIEKSEPQEILLLLKIVSEKQESSSKFLKTRYIELDEKVFAMEQRINN